MNIRFVATSIFCMSLVSSVAFPAKTQQDILLNAIKNNSGAGVQQALIDIVKQGKDGKSPEIILLKAIMTGTTDDIKKSVQPVLEQGKNNMSPTIWAMLLQKPSALEALLECGAKFDAGVGALLAKMGDIKTALVIVRSGVDISAIMDNYIELALRFIAEHPSDQALELIQELIKHGYNVDRILNFEFSNSFKCVYTDEAVFNLLIKNGINPNQIIVSKRTGLTSTPILRAIEWGSEKAVITLLDAGANINQKAQQNGKTYSPLSWAIECGRTSMIPFFLERGATL